MLDGIAWYLLITFIGLLALPLAYRLLPHLADRGYIFARTLGLLVWGFIFWLLASFGLLQNNTAGVLLALVLMAGLVFLVGGGLSGFRESYIFMRRRPRLVFLTELLFLGAFIFAMAMRAGYPDIANTEKPMELSFINAILRSPQFPPNDPWLSGYSISYYYFGYVLVAMLIRLTGVSSGVGFNLAISSLFALTALGAYGISYNLLAAWSKRRREQGKPGVFSQGWALLAPAFVLIVSNLEGLFEILHARGLFWEQVGGQWQSAFWHWLDLPDLTQPPSLPFTWGINRPGWWWWRASRVIQDYDLSGGYHEVIDEFPFFSYFLADLHPHVLSMPFVLLATALALNFYLGFSRQETADFSVRTWLRRADFWFTAIILGGLAFLNTWDFPIYLALFSAAFVLVRFQFLGWNLKARLLDFVRIALALGLAGILLYLPFYFGFASQAGGILPSMAFFSRGVQFWIMFAPFLVPIFVFLAWMWSQQGSRASLKSGLKFGAWVIGGLWIFSYLLGSLAINLPAIGQALGGNSGSGLLPAQGASFIQWGQMFLGLQGAANGSYLLVTTLLQRITTPGTWLTLLVLFVLVWGLFSTFRRQSAASVPEPGITEPAVPPLASVSTLPFILLLVLVGAGLTVVPEFIYLRDQFGGRMNTIFKFYFEAWIVWGTAAAVAMVILLVELRRGHKLIFGLVSGAVLACALIYPAYGIAERIQPGQMDLTLDGTAYLSRANPDEIAGIDWLGQAPVGTVVEAVGGQYSEYARVSMLSGDPSVLGWPGHESQWRGGAKEIGSRESDIDRLYRTTDWNETQAILQNYGIRYVFIGGLERNKYKVSEAKFKAHLAQVFTQGNVAVYEVPDVVLTPLQ